jgi:hypothetical protein
MNINRREQNDEKQKCIFRSIGTVFCFGPGIDMVDDASFGRGKSRKDPL